MIQCIPHGLSSTAAYLFYFAELYSIYKDADHYWDFDHPNNIVDNITSQQATVYGDVMAERSLTDTGLRLLEGTEIVLKPSFGDECPVDPTQCTQGLIVSVFVKIIGTGEQYWGYKFLFGNINTPDFAQITGHKGFVVGVQKQLFQIFVVSDNYVCRCIDCMDARRNLWTHLAFSWKNPSVENPGLKITIDGNEWPWGVQCISDIGNRTLLQNISLGSRTEEALITADFDNLAVWYNNTDFLHSTLKAPWDYLTGKLRFYFRRLNRYTQVRNIFRAGD